MIGKRCKHIETNHIGIITKEMGGNKYFPDQWGIRWDSGKQIQDKGLQYYWQDKDKIITI